MFVVAPVGRPGAFGRPGAPFIVPSPHVAPLPRSSHAALARDSTLSKHVVRPT